MRCDVGDTVRSTALDYRHDVPTPLSTDAGRLARTREVVADVSARLRDVCAHFPEAEFLALVRKIADLSVKFRAAGRRTPVRC